MLTHEMDETYTQEDIDRAFADLDSILATERPTPHQPTGVCVQCGHASLVRASAFDGETVCDACGVIQPGVNLPTEYYFPLPRKYSNYKRIHHWHERISQLLLLESAIPDQDFRLIATKLCDGTHPVLNKDCIRAVLRSLNMQLYIEKWLQIIHRITGIMPPMPGPLLVRQLDTLFLELQQPFECYKPASRKNFLNYNYVFCRLFQKIGCPQFCMFFPLIKSRQKLRALDETWNNMTASIDWDSPTLQVVAPFAVRLETPSVLLRRICSRIDDSAQAEQRKERLKMECHTLGHYQTSTLSQLPKLRRSDLLVLESQTRGWATKRSRYT